MPCSSNFGFFTPAEHATPEEEGGGGRGGRGSVSVRSTVWDFVGGDLLRPNLGKWLDGVEKHKALAIYPPHEGGYEGRYLNRLRYQGYYFLDLSARGLGDPETTLTKVHLVCSPSLGRQPVARWYFPPEVDYRLSLLHPDTTLTATAEEEVEAVADPLGRRVLERVDQGVEEVLEDGHGEEHGHEDGGGHEPE
ncbi:NAD(P)H-quinone oxidoreductase subunit N, chloroplastic [Zea mays]|uniref:NAD(P)H-quinone oxidoreductase subunit N, chloroplastic n=1 Tax=Zea mays TaxID=4577 RepID=A0A3L6E0K5_MAIZE|nr:NAD(P)H-quinone oxidoreductase subunit N, chloroplastic [Zea mays]